MSNDDDVPKSVVCTCCGVGYDAGARIAVMVIVPAVSTVTKVEACPLWSVSTVQLPAPPQIEKATAGIAVKNTLAPATGVTPSGARTCTRMGLGACPPTGVDGFDPESSLMLSLGPAP